MVFHSPIARRASTAITATPAAPRTAPTRPPRLLLVEQSPAHCRRVMEKPIRPPHRPPVRMAANARKRAPRDGSADGRGGGSCSVTGAHVRVRTLSVRNWTVAGGLVESDAGLLLVQNRRRNGSFDWSPPGGVIEVAEGESVVDGLTREVQEETGLLVTEWLGPLYEVQAD